MQSDADNTELFMRDASSIAPFAVEIKRRAPAFVAADDEHHAELPATAKRGWFLASGAAIVALSLVSALALRVPPAARTSGQPHAHRVVAAHEAVMFPVLTAPAKDLIVIDEDEASTIPVSALPSHRATTSTPRSAHSGGLLRFAPSIKGILIDGAPHRIERGTVSLPCGTHTIKVPPQPARTITIACAS